MNKLPHLFLFLLAIAACPELHAREVPITWGDDVWQLQIDPASGALVHIENKSDPQHMNWLREAGRWERGKWIADPSPEAVTLDGRWGLVESPQIGQPQVAQVRKLSDRAWEAVYTSLSLTLTVHRELDDKGDLTESYTFKNTGDVAVNFPVGSLAITAPFFDQYPDAARSLAARCHTHLWMGGNFAWINAMRMGTQPPHLGLIVTQGSLDAYSQRGGTYNDRGVFLLHPTAMNIAPGKSETVAWKLFWHKGWDDFFSKLSATDDFVRLTAKHYTVTVGQPLEITAESAASLESAQVLANGEPVKVQAQGWHLSAVIPTVKIGEVLVELLNNKQRTWLRANVIPLPDELIASRVKFIVRHQQRNAKGDSLNGAYLAYDNETGKQVYDQKNDHNAGRERVGMGVLGALYLPLCKDEAFKAELKESLERYSTFIARELEDDSGVVYNDVGRSKYNPTHNRLYNAPWVAHFHLAMYRATGDSSQLDRFVRVLRSYYAQGGAKYYAIGIPITDGLKALEEAGRSKERAELLADFRTHADIIVKNGPNYPPFEVNYEQSIVAPAVQLMTEMYLATGEKSYLEGVKQQMPLLEAFCGKQPDFRLNEVAIRHWDDYWFGKLQLYGDTMPHYWSTVNAVAYAYYGRATGEQNWFERADTILKANLSLFNADGNASCANLYALTTNGQPAAKNDPWALVNLLKVRGITKP